MSDRNGYDPGTPSWVDLSTPDPDASAKFYGEVFGWEAVEAGPPRRKPAAIGSSCTTASRSAA